MLIHLLPKLYAPVMSESRVLEFKSSALGLQLLFDRDIVNRQPFPNKRYEVVCRKVGRKAVNGILIKTDQFIPEFDTVTRWFINGREIEHHVRYVVLDREFDFVSADMTMWYGTTDVSGEYKSRWPEWASDAPVYLQPRMDVYRKANGGTETRGEVTDTVLGAHVMRRDEVFRLPTLEPERLGIRVYNADRNPALEHAFIAEINDENVQPFKLNEME